MSDEEHSQEPSGPLMIAATKILRAPPTRISSLGAFTLPRSIAVRTAAIVVACAIPGALVGLIILKLQGFMFGAIAGGMVGYVMATWSPVKGETLFQYLGAAGQTRLRQRPVTYNGEPAALYIGVARITRINAGEVHLFPGAVDVHPDSHDERGAPRSAENRNLTGTLPKPAVRRPEFRGAHELGLDRSALAPGIPVSDTWLKAPPELPEAGPGAGRLPDPVASAGTSELGERAAPFVPGMPPTSQTQPGPQSHRPGPAAPLHRPGPQDEGSALPAPPRRRIPRPDDPQP